MGKTAKAQRALSPIACRLRPIASLGGICLSPIGYRLSRTPPHLSLDLIHIAPGPALSRLDGANQRMRYLAKMPGSMLVLRRITAADMTAGEAETQMDPSVPGLYAVLTNVCMGAGDLDLIEMRTLRLHGASDATPIREVAAKKRRPTSEVCSWMPAAGC
jgi:hypothetical protein